MRRETERRVIIFGTLVLTFLGGILAPTIVQAIDAAGRQVDESQQEDLSGLVTAICYYPDGDTSPVCITP